MLANYGYTDGSGQWYITIDTDKCSGCGDCIQACPHHMFEVITNDYDEKQAEVIGKFRKDIKYLCGPCKPVTNRPPLPCVAACKPLAIVHSW